MHSAAKVLFLLLIIWKCKQLSTSIGLTPNRRFMNSGVVSITTTQTYNNSTAANWDYSS